MRAMRRIFLLSALLITGCVNQSTVQPVQSHNANDWHFAIYQHVQVQGNYPLTIMPATDNVVSLKIVDDETNHDNVKTHITGNTLWLNLHNFLPGGKAILYLPATTQKLTLENLSNVSGQANVLSLHVRHVDQVNLSSSSWMLQHLLVESSRHVHLSGVGTPYLNACINDTNDISVNGTMSVRDLKIHNSQSVLMYWLNSPILTVDIDRKSSALLSGVANFANMKAENDAKLDAKYLRAHRVFVKADDAATAEVTALDSLNAFAAGKSNIYYYHQPKLLSTVHSEEGSILYMGEMPPPCNFPYCPVLPKVLPG